MGQTKLEVFFDVETKSWFEEGGKKDPSILGVSIVSLYEREIDEENKEVKGTMQSFWESEFDKMWRIFEKAHRIIGFNSIRFDVATLKPYAPPSFSKLPHFDILEEIRRITNHRVSLDRLAKEILGRQKIDSGANAVAYWLKKDKESLAKLKKYCEEDVAITRDIYDYAIKNKSLSFKDHWNNLRKIEVDFSYKIEPSQEEPANQGSLF